MAIRNHFALLEQVGVPSARAKGCGDRGACPLGAQFTWPLGKSPGLQKGSDGSTDGHGARGDRTRNAPTHPEPHGAS